MEEQKVTRNNAKAVDDLNYAIGVNRKLLSPMGIWPLKRNASKLEARVKLFKISITGCMLFALMAPQYLSFAFTKRTTSEYLELAAQQIWDVMNITKFFVMILKGEDIRYCVHCIEDDWTNVKFKEDRNKMYSNAKVGRYLTISCLGFMVGGVAAYVTAMPFLRARFVGTGTIIRGNVSVPAKPLAYPTDLLFLDEQLTPVYQIVWVMHVITSIYSIALSCGGYSLTAILVAHACGQLQVVESRLERIVQTERADFSNVQRRIASTVDHHLYVMQYADRINRALGVLFLAEELGAISSICFAGYSLVTSWSDLEHTNALMTSIYTVLLIANILNFFVISFVGQLLKDKNEELNAAASRVKWYQLQPKIARSLILFMARSSRPLVLSACSMFEMSLSNFGDVLRGAFVFLNMVRETGN